MGLLWSNCLKGVYEDFPSGPFRKPSKTRRQVLEALLSDKENADVDGRKNTAQPQQFADSWRTSPQESPGSHAESPTGFNMNQHNNTGTGTPDYQKDQKSRKVSFTFGNN